jgi:hypothetical protein
MGQCDGVGGWIGDTLDLVMIFGGSSGFVPSIMPCVVQKVVRVK